jgi:hypothetical protein
MAVQGREEAKEVDLGFRKRDLATKKGGAAN